MKLPDAKRQELEDAGWQPPERGPGGGARRRLEEERRRRGLPTGEEGEGPGDSAPPDGD